MSVKTPHYLLFSESRRESDRGQWRFVLQSVDGSAQLEAADDEPDLAGERLELLAVVRGLEALEQPSQVTLVTPSKYVNRGISYGLPEWRSSGWQWEHFGEMVPIKNRDLWQRVDRALDYHRVDCRTWRFDLPHGPVANDQAANPSSAPTMTRASRSVPKPKRIRLKRPPASLRRRLRKIVLRCERMARAAYESARLRLAQLGTQLLPQPWLD